MGLPAARVGDMHVCPMLTGPVPHVGGPIAQSACPTVLIGKMPSAQATSMATCVGPPRSSSDGQSHGIDWQTPCCSNGGYLCSRRDNHTGLPNCIDWIKLDVTVRTALKRPQTRRGC